MKKILYLFAILVLLASCQKDNSLVEETTANSDRIPWMAQIVISNEPNLTDSIIVKVRRGGGYVVLEEYKTYGQDTMYVTGSTDYDVNLHISAWKKGNFIVTLNIGYDNRPYTDLVYFHKLYEICNYHSNITYHL